MNTKYTLPEVAAKLSSKTGLSRRVCESFLKEMFRHIADALSSDENVKIKQLGAFKLTEIEARRSVNVNTGEQIEIPGHKRVSFTAAKELAERVNEPFAAFESVELSPDITEDELNACNDNASGAASVEPAIEIESDINASPLETENPNIDVPLPENSRVEESLSDSSLGLSTATSRQMDEASSIAEHEVHQEIEKQSEIKDDAESQKQHVEQEQLIPDTTCEPNVPVASDQSNNSSHMDSSEDCPQDNSQRKSTKKSGQQFRIGLLVGMLIMLFLCAVGFTLYTASAPQQAKSDKKTILKAETNLIPVKDTIVQESVAIKSIEDSTQIEKLSEPATQPSDKSDEGTTPKDEKKVYDTISKTRYLTTMAKEHYGNYHLWPYIYEENKAFLGHPDRIKPGTKVVIPPLSKYGVNAKNSADIAKAKKKGVEIYSRYK